jgi:drug/metabolite transporter (DMT)-like permease
MGAGSAGDVKAGVYLALTGQTLISAGTYLVATRALQELTPFTLLFCRFLTSALIFLVLLAVVPGPRLPPLRALPAVLGLGLLAGPMNQGCFFYGLSHSFPSHAAFLYALTPVGVFAYGLVRGEERVSPSVLGGILLAFGGVLVLLLGRGLGAALGPVRGDLFILAAVAAWVVYTVEGRELVAKHGFFRATAWTMTVGALVPSPAAAWLLDARAVTHASATTWACIGYLALFTSVISYFLWYYALGRLVASKVAVFSNLQPIATALGAWALLGTPLTWEVGVGGALVLVGVRATQKGRQRPAT